MSITLPPRVWQRMLSGKRLNLVDPHVDDVRLHDIALGLSRISRWNGQTVGNHAFSVAQHSLLVYELLQGHLDALAKSSAELFREVVCPDLIWPPSSHRSARPISNPYEGSCALGLCALLHDAPEFVIGDLISPFKSLVGSTYIDIEVKLLQVIRRAFGLPDTIPSTWESLIKAADRAAAYLESSTIAGFSGEDADLLFTRDKDFHMIHRDQATSLLPPWPAWEARDRFSTMVDLLHTAWTGKKSQQSPHQTVN